MRSRLPQTGLLALLLLAGILLAACDRVFSEDPENEPDGDLELGTFKGQAGERSNQGFEALEGPAAFELVRSSGNSSVLLIRLKSQLPNFEVPTTLDFAMITADVPVEGTYGIGGPSAGSDQYFVACFSSPNFPEAPYESESGEFVITTSSGGVVEGTFEMIAYGLVPTGPTSAERVRLDVSGSFNARNAATNAQPAAVLACADED